MQAFTQTLYFPFRYSENGYNQIQFVVDTYYLYESPPPYIYQYYRNSLAMNHRYC